MTRYSCYKFESWHEWLKDGNCFHEIIKHKFAFYLLDSDKIPN
jgi:hypothetical protein